MDTKSALMNYLSDPIRQLEGLVHMPFCSRFFEPRAQFVDWCKQTYPSAFWIDCGAGQGHITKLLRENGMQAAGLDLYAPTEDAVINDLINMDCVKFPFTDKMVVLLCRPCRGDWIHATIIKAVESGCPMIYIGKQSHFNDDLAPLPYKVELVLSDIGMDGENLWIVSK